MLLLSPTLLSTDERVVLFLIKTPFSLVTASSRLSTEGKWLDANKLRNDSKCSSISLSSQFGTISAIVKSNCTTLSRRRPNKIAMCAYVHNKYYDYERQYLVLLSWTRLCRNWIAWTEIWSQPSEFQNEDNLLSQTVHHEQETRQDRVHSHDSNLLGLSEISVAGVKLKDLLWHTHTV